MKMITDRQIGEILRSLKGSLVMDGEYEFIGDAMEKEPVMPLPGAADERYFPYLLAILSSWHIHHPEETADSLQDMALFAITAREDVRHIWNKSRDPKIIFKLFQEYCKKQQEKVNGNPESATAPR